MTESTRSPATSRGLIVSHLRDFADFLPEKMREDFNATIDDAFAASETLCKAVSGCRGSGEYAEQIFTCEECGDVTESMQCPLGRSAAAASKSTEAALRYLLDSTAPRGQWADQAVHSFVGAMLNDAAVSVPSAIRRSTAPAARPAIGEANLSGWAVAWTAMERYADYLETQAARWEALLWRWGSGTVTLDCDDQGRFRLHVEHAEAADECHVGDEPESVIDSAISKEEEQQNG